MAGALPCNFLTAHRFFFPRHGIGGDIGGGAGRDCRTKPFSMPMNFGHLNADYVAALFIDVMVRGLYGTRWHSASP